MPAIDESAKNAFRETVWEYYREHGRGDLPWRQPESDGTFSAYKITVSELMLQQTQVSRVIPKYQAFLEQFPDIRALAAAEQGDVLRAWSGLGYNRRAKFLHQAAKQVAADYGGQFPDDEATLVGLPGIGHATANAILAYAFDQPVSFIETNIRTVYIHHFFNDSDKVPDKSLQPVIEQMLEREQPREWYWALMDYGTYLKRSVGNLNKLSNTYSKQSRFEGSLRQIRGRVIHLLGNGSCPMSELRQEIDDPRLEAVITELVGEGLVRRHGNTFSL